MEKKALKYFLCVVFWCLISSAQAVTLSNIEMKSYLNQKLDARIALGGISAEDLQNLEMRFITATEGSVERSTALSAELINDKSGQYIQITSKEIMREPVLVFTLELSWPAGRLQREYSLLIDPKN